MEANRLRSPLRWAGSKRQLLPQLEQFWRPTDGKYIEAFAGSACLFFHIQPDVAILNDTNSDLINAFKVLSNHPILLHHYLTGIKKTAETYYKQRKSNCGLDDFDAAVRFFYLNRHCFNGIYRTNRAGQFNVPFGGDKAGGFPSIEQWLRAARLLSRADLKCEDFEKVVLDNVKAGDFVYLDPPYAVSNRRVFVQYSGNEFGINDLKRLRSVMDQIDRIGATFVVSYAMSRETKILSDGWSVSRKLAQRNVAGFSHQRRKAVEVLITNDQERIPSR